MFYPKRLKYGDTIGIVAPSSPVSSERAESCIKCVEHLGFKVKAADNLSQSKGGYMAGNEKMRASWINQMFADDEVDAIICLRGGDGANRIMDYIDLDTVKKNGKIFVGYSDITSLHLLFNQVCGLVTYHGLMVFSNILDSFDKESKKAFFDMLMKDGDYLYKAPEGKPLGIAREGVASGMITGGNLTVMCNSIGTEYEIDTDGKILFIEEVGGHIGNIDRNIYQLKNSGKLENVKGILIGQFTRCRIDEPDYGVVEVILDAIEEKDIPVMYDVESGHDFPMISIPMGALCDMDTETDKIIFY